MTRLLLAGKACIHKWERLRHLERRMEKKSILGGLGQHGPKIRETRGTGVVCVCVCVYTCESECVCV